MQYNRLQFLQTTLETSAIFLNFHLKIHAIAAAKVKDQAEEPWTLEVKKINLSSASVPKEKQIKLNEHFWVVILKYE